MNPMLYPSFTHPVNIENDMDGYSFTSLGRNVKVWSWPKPASQAGK